MAKGGKIQEPDIVEKKVYDIGKKFARSLDPAIKANEQWRDSFKKVKEAALEYAKIENEFRSAKGRNEVLEVKKKEIELRNKATAAVKQEKEAYLNLQKAKTEKLRQEKLAIEIENKLTRVKKKNIKLTIEEKVKNQALAKIKKYQARATLGLVGPYEKLNRKLTEARNKAKDVGVAFGETSKQFKKAQQEVIKLDARLKKLDQALGQSQRFVGEYGRNLSQLKGIYSSLVSALGYTGGFIAFTQVLSNSFKIIREFSKEMANLRAITRSDAKELEVLARKLGETTVFTANEAAKAMSLLAMAGYNTNQILKATPEVLNLAAAGNISLAKAADIASNVLSGFGYSADRTNEVVDVLARTATSTNTSIESLGDSFKEIAPTARNLKIPMTEVSGAIGILGNSGIKGTDATNSLNTALNRLSKPTKKMLTKMKELNLQFFDSQGEFIGLTKMVEHLNERFKGLTTEQKAAAIATLFGAHANKQMTSLVNGQVTAMINNKEVILKGADALKYLTKEYEHSEGAAKRMADTQLDSLDGALRLLKSAWEGYVLGVDESSGASNKLKVILVYLAKNLKNIIGAITTAAAIWLAYKGVIITYGLAQKIATAATVAHRIAIVAMNRGVMSAVRSMKALKASLIKSGMGIALVLVASLVYELSNLGKSYNAVASAQKLAAKNTIKEKSNLESLIKIAKNEKISKEEREKAIKKINKLSPEYLGNITLETINTKEATKAVEDYIKELDRKALAQALSEKKTELMKKLVDAENIVVGENVNLWDQTAAAIKTVGNATAFTDNVLNKSIDKKNKKIKDLKEQIKTLDSTLVNYLKKGKISLSEEGTPARKTTVNAKKDTSEKSEKERKEIEKRIAEDTISLVEHVKKQRIEAAKSIFENEKYSIEERQEALKKQIEAETDLINFQTEVKLRKINYATNEELKIIAAGGSRAIALKEEIAKRESSARLLIEKQKQSALKSLDLKREEGQDKLELEYIKEQAELQKAITEKALSEEIASEYQAFKNKEGIYKDAVNAVEEREKRIAEIKRRYAIKALEAQIDVIEKLLDNEELSATKRAEYEQKLAKAKSDLAEASNSGDDDLNLEKKKEFYEEVAQKAGEILDGLGNEVFDSRIAMIDEEIAKNDEKYDKLLENENLTEEERKGIEDKREKEREALEAKKRKQQRKQAIFNKALAASEIAMNTAKALIGIWAEVPKVDFGVSAGLMTAFVSSLGAVQLATVAAQKIPQYAKGTEHHPGGDALVGEERPEVILEPGKDAYVVSKPTILDLPKSTKVVPSIEAYNKLMSAAILTNLEVKQKKLNDFQASMVLNNNYNELLNEMKKNTEATEKIKTNVIVNQTPPPDIDHQWFRLQNNNWQA
ncbi:phage tail tape measure protein [Aquimarina hainanensis]|uniref:Phage tail tape measure protein n=1 Tax=Aquimarina hainanensis TaxID=1578017 RepID=A0ABW5N9J9_9FLAO